MNKADKARLSALSNMPCVACAQEELGDSLAEVHHLVAGGRRLGHQYTIPLCFLHHRSGKATPEYISRHPFKREFERRYGTEQTLLDIVNRRLDATTT